MGARLPDTLHPSPRISIACAVLALADELRQAGVPGRELRLNDLIADGVGIAAGAVLALIVRRRLAGRSGA
jgi:VanZ family protein